MVEKNQFVEVEVEKLVYGGKALSRHEDLVIFTEGLVPGDRAVVQVLKKHKNYAEAEVVEITQPSPKRIKARCPFFGECGGCTWQDLSYGEQLAVKEGILRETLENITGIETALKPVIPSLDEWHYRNKTEFTFGENQGQQILGFHHRGKFDEIVPVSSCLIQSEKMNGILKIVQDWAFESGLRAYNPRLFKGFLRHLVIRHARNTDEIMVHLSTRSNVKTERVQALSSLLKEKAAVFIWSTNDEKSDAVKVGEVRMVSGAKHIIESLGVVRFKVGALTFFQTNTEGAEKMIGIVLRMAGLSGVETVFDVYCGVGTFALSLAGRAKKVYGVELVPESIAAAKENASLNGFSNCVFESSSIENFLKKKPELPFFDVIVVDPPRSGLSPRVVEAVNDFAPKKLIYISCNPATLARDLRLFSNLGFKLKEVQPIDLFPQTYHLETICLLEKNKDCLQI